MTAPDISERAFEAHTIHASLYRPVLFAGAEPPVVILEGATAFALLFGIGFHVATVLLAGFYLGVVHSLMVWVATQDPHMTALYIRSLNARDYYPAHARAHAAPAAVYPAIPQSR